MNDTAVSKDELSVCFDIIYEGGTYSILDREKVKKAKSITLAAINTYLKNIRSKNGLIPGVYRVTLRVNHTGKVSLETFHRITR